MSVVLYSTACKFTLFVPCVILAHEATSGNCEMASPTFSLTDILIRGRQTNSQVIVSDVPSRREKKVRTPDRRLVLRLSISRSATNFRFRSCAWSRLLTQSFSFSKMADESKTKRFRNEPRSTLSCYALRLQPGQEVRECLLKYVREKKLTAPFVLSCVGSVTQATLRLANAARDTPNEVRTKKSVNAFTCHAWKTPGTSVSSLSPKVRDAGLLFNSLPKNWRGLLACLAALYTRGSRALRPLRANFFGLDQFPFWNCYTG